MSAEKPYKPKGSAVLQQWIDEQRGTAPALPLQPAKAFPGGASATTAAGQVVATAGKDAPRPWPRLSHTLPHTRDPRFCQSCGVDYLREDLSLWQECDDQDKPEQVFVPLCGACSDQLIKPHPRLYHRLGRHQPVPGCIPPLCGRCLFRDIPQGLACRHTAQKRLGGSGLNITHPEPIRGFVDGQNYRGAFMHFTGPATDCAGFTLDTRPGQTQLRGERSLPRTPTPPEASVEEDDGPPANGKPGNTTPPDQGDEKEVDW